MLSSPHLASPSAVQTLPTGVSTSAAKNKGMDNYKQRKYADATKWLSWAVILLEKTCDGAASMEVLSSRASCYKEVGEYKKDVVDCTKLIGRVEEKRRWPEGIHQVVEAKEGVKIELAEAAKAQFSRDYSDNLALVRDYKAWKEVERDVAGYEYCWKNFLYAQSMKAIDAL
ncbi:hypothetical protein LOK49_Contig5G00017 [Camellia lanceoleosa]|nr:hypothetical protein LOK49_Contig5G00017 [Camellia lanceoleosa]